MPGEPRYSLAELADLAGVTPRTVRYYLASGLLPGVGQPGPGAKYGDDHLDRLRLIRRLQRDHLPLAEIRRRLAGLDATAIRDLADPGPLEGPGDTAIEYIRTILGTSARSTSRSTIPARPLASREAPPAPAASAAPLNLARRLSEPMPESSPEPHGTSESPTRPTVERSQWERVVLAPDVELHLRRPSSRTQNKRIDRLIAIARELLEED